MIVRPSMGTVGDAYYNAIAESFFATLECELIARRSWKTKTEARLAVFCWIESWHNPHRRHSALNYLSPKNFERKHHDNTVNPETQIIPEPSMSKLNVSVEMGQFQDFAQQPCRCSLGKMGGPPFLEVLQL